MKNKYEDIYVYRIANNKIVEIPAFIIVNYDPKGLLLTRTAFDRDNNIIVAEIGKEPGMVFNNSVWFRKKQFNKAKNIFLSDLSYKLQKVEEERATLRDKIGFISDQKEV